MIEFITENLEIVITITTLLLVIIGYIVKKTENTTDDAIFSVISKFIKDFLEGLKTNKPLDKRDDSKINTSGLTRRKEDDMKIEIKEDIEPTETEVK